MEEVTFQKLTGLRKLKNILKALFQENCNYYWSVVLRLYTSFFYLFEEEQLLKRNWRCLLSIIIQLNFNTQWHCMSPDNTTHTIYINCLKPSGVKKNHQKFIFSDLLCINAFLVAVLAVSFFIYLAILHIYLQIFVDV